MTSWRLHLTGTVRRLSMFFSAGPRIALLRVFFFLLLFTLVFRYVDPAHSHHWLVVIFYMDRNQNMAGHQGNDWLWLEGVVPRSAQHFDLMERRQQDLLYTARLNSEIFWVIFVAETLCHQILLDSLNFRRTCVSVSARQSRVAASRPSL